MMSFAAGCGGGVVGTSPDLSGTTTTSKDMAMVKGSGDGFVTNPDDSAVDAALEEASVPTEGGVIDAPIGDLAGEDLTGTVSNPDGFVGGDDAGPADMAKHLPDMVFLGDLTLPQIACGLDGSAACPAKQSICSPTTHMCVVCLGDTDCPAGELCDVAGGQCSKMGCAADHPSCPNNFHCDIDAGTCFACTQDTDCGPGATPRCDTEAHKCVACLPALDNCPTGQMCSAAAPYVCGAATPCTTNAQCGTGTGKVCGPNGVCVNGCSATSPCTDGDTCCSTKCFDMKTDVKNCGACGHACTLGQVCCNGTCATESGDSNNCGGCGIVCAVQNGTPACASSHCSVHACTAPFDNCNKQYADGCETNLNTDPLHCGSCGTACALMNANAVCVNGACAIPPGNCIAPFADCNGDPTDGCETNLQSESANCGACGNACGAPPNGFNANWTCSSGTCTVTTCSTGFGDCNNDSTDGCESDLSSDVNNCNACGSKCEAGSIGTPVCQQSKCGVMCNGTGTLENCSGNPADGCQIDISMDPFNCGACNSPCSNVNISNLSCDDAICDGACDQPWANCDNTKKNNGCNVNTSIDPMNCGGCGTVCPNTNIPTPTCDNGACDGQCAPGFLDCDFNEQSDGCEIDGNTDVNNCGACGTICTGVNIPTPGCTAGVCSGDCATGFADCDGNKQNDGCEVDITSDVSNCGACNAKCPHSGITIVDCSNGVCDGACSDGFADCNNDKLLDGCEIQTSSDPDNCGGCGASFKCSNANMSSRTCGDSTCDGACTTGYADCNNDKLADGCETNTQNDPLNCGKCTIAGDPSNNNACSTNNIPTPVCVLGNCTGNCAPGTADCDNNKAADGCEIDLTTDAQNCGACNNACSANHISVPTCTPNGKGGGTCGGACDAGWADCNGQPSDGCETNLLADAANCGTCSTVCSPNHVPNPSCVNGSCTITACENGFGDCDSNAQSNGCETNLNTSLANCGGCGLQCSNQNIVTVMCTAGVCNGACVSGFADCNGSKQTDGCEVTTASDPNQCGACGAACSGVNVQVRTCTSSTCSGSCVSGFAHCDPNTTLAASGCETNLGTNPTYCGSCTTTCSNEHITTPLCANSKCTGLCDSGFADCDNDKTTNGCEINTQNDLKNCGSCGSKCSSTNIDTNSQACSGGQCAGNCLPGFANCHGSLGTNGCETNTSNDYMNCGACGQVCPATHVSQVCIGGNCSGTCTGTFQDCDNNKLTNGCEIDTGNDVNNCGGCSNSGPGFACSSNHITPKCVSSTCNNSAAVCSAGYADCNSNKQLDGCETQINATDVNNCGGCSVKCSTTNIQTNSCTSGTCTGTCKTNFANCDSTKQANGCNINTSTDISNCGGCGNQCVNICNNAANHVASNTCSAGVCQVTTGGSGCVTGYLDFNNSCTDGCECKKETTDFTCASPSDFGTLTLGVAGTKSASQVLVVGSESWYKVTFSNNANLAYHPLITLVGGPEFIMDIDTNQCTNAAVSIGCQEDANGSKARSSFENKYQTTGTAADPATPSGTFTPVPYPAASLGGTAQQVVLIRVYRSVAGNASPTCNPFTLTVSE